MPRSGGESDKLGNRYEGLWTVGRVLDVAIGRLAGITVEPLDEDPRGIEFVARRHDGVREFHSVKRQRSEGEWTLSALTRPDSRTGRSILFDLFNKLTATDRELAYFVSSTSATRASELVELATCYPNASWFEDRVRKSKPLTDGFEKYVLPLTSDDWSRAYTHFRKLRIEPIGEALLRDQIEHNILLMIYRPDGREFAAAEVRVLLADFVLGCLGTELQEDRIWDFLRTHGFLRKDWATDARTHDQIRDYNERYVRSVAEELINGVYIERPEAKSIVTACLNRDGPRRVLVSGQAGLGKSCVIARAVKELRATAVPTLVIRLDQFGDVHNTQQLGSQIGLSRSPVVVLAGMANGGEAVLVVDQLDACSQISGRYPHLWDVFDALSQEADEHPNLRIVAACRDFDLVHDRRLRKLKDSKAYTHVAVSLLPESDVRLAVQARGYNCERLSEEQIRLLQTPLHLYLFLEGADQQLAPVAIRGLGDLFDRYWERKERKVRERLQHRSDWAPVIDAMCDSMSRNHRLYVIESRLDEWPATKDAMLTEHVLVKEENRIRFFHESFFDYAFARRFCTDGQEILGLLQAGEQHLFVRSQVRQVLTYLRGHDWEAYLRQLRGVLLATTVRFHVKRLVLAWLAVLPTPKPEEWEVLDATRNNPDLFRFALPAARNSLAWFDLLHAVGVFSNWLGSGDESVINRAMWFLDFPTARNQRSAVVAELLSPFCGTSPAWSQRLRRYFYFGDAHHTRPIQELFLRLLQEGILDQDPENRHSDSWWSALHHEAGKQAPGFVLEAICTWLDREIGALPVVANDELRRSSPDDHGAALLIEEVAAHDRATFVAAILPRVLRIVQGTILETEVGLRRDSWWPYPSNLHGQNARDRLLVQLLRGVEGLAVSDPALLLSLLGGFTDTDSSTITRLLLRAWAANPPRFATQCVEFLIADPRRLDFGYSSWSGDGNGHAAFSRDAIAACVPFLSSELRSQLETAIIGFLPQYELKSYDGWHERLLLESFGEQFLTAEGRRRLDALRNRFPDQSIELPPPAASGMRVVGSPIPANEARTLTDEQWLAAMEEHCFDWDSSPHGPLRGSAVELSRELEPLAGLDRQRFAALVHQMGDEIHPAYFDAILAGICGEGKLSADERKADTEAFDQFDTETLLGVIRRLDRLPNHPCGRTIGRAFERISKRQIPDSDLRILEYYASDPTSPSSDEQWWVGSPESPNNPEEAHVQGYNSVRGIAANAIKHLLFDDYTRAGLFVPIIERMISDPSIAVRTCVADALLPILNHDRDHAVVLFARLCAGIESAFGAYPFANFVRYASRSHYTQLQPVLLSALNSCVDASVSAAAQEICLAAFSVEAAQADAATVRSGSQPMRAAAAGVYAHNVGDSEIRSVCEEHLQLFFSDPAQEVRETAAGCFHHISGAELESYAEFIAAYVESPAFPSPHDNLVRQLEQSSVQLPEVSLRVAERFLEVSGRDASDISTAAAGDSASVSKLVVRLYAQSLDDRSRSKCLELIDEMERFAVYGIDAQLDEHDR